MYALVKMYIGLWTQKQKRPGHVFWIMNKFYVLEQLLKYTTSEPTSVFGLALLNNKKSYPLYVSTFPYGQPGDAMWMDRPLVLHQNNSNSTPLPKPFPPEESLNKPVREQCWLIIHSFSLSLSFVCTLLVLVGSLSRWKSQHTVRKHGAFYPVIVEPATSTPQQPTSPTWRHCWNPALQQMIPHSDVSTHVNCLQADRLTGDRIQGPGIDLESNFGRVKGKLRKCFGKGLNEYK